MLRISFDLGDADLQRLAEAAQQTQALARQQPANAIIAAAREVLEKGLQAHHADFVKERYSRLRSMLDMFADEQWALPEEDRQRVINALACFNAPAAASGLLDHAIMIELVSRDLRRDLDAYRDFCRLRATRAKRRKSPAADDQQWLNERREKLQQRMHERRRRDLDAAGSQLRRFLSLLGLG
jgi:hypothetical protein